MAVTELGIVNEVRFEHQENVPSQMTITVSGIV